MLPITISKGAIPRNSIIEPIGGQVYRKRLPIGFRAYHARPADVHQFDPSHKSGSGKLGGIRTDKRFWDRLWRFT